MVICNPNLTSILIFMQHSGKNPVAGAKKAGQKKQSRQ
jgi:hypothetical protein